MRKGSHDEHLPVWPDRCDDRQLRSLGNSAGADRPRYRAPVSRRRRARRGAHALYCDQSDANWRPHRRCRHNDHARQRFPRARGDPHSVGPNRQVISGRRPPRHSTLTPAPTGAPETVDFAPRGANGWSVPRGVHPIHRSRSANLSAGDPKSKQANTRSSTTARYRSCGPAMWALCKG